MTMEQFDLAVIGAGAAGMMCAGVAAQSGLRVALIDHSGRIGEKIRISGGGRCNFTNLHTAPECFVSSNPGFCRSALARYTPRDFLALLARHGVPWHEKHRGQLFCDRSAEDVIQVLVAECDAGDVVWRTGVSVSAVAREAAGGRDVFRLDTSAGVIRASQLVIATGGLSVPQIGATDFGHRIARQFGLRVIEPRPALVPLEFPADAWRPFAELAGVALPVRIAVLPQGGKRLGAFDEDLLLTHRGLSGPAVLQASSYWNPGDALTIDLLPGERAGERLVAEKGVSRKQLATVLGQWLPARLAASWADQQGLAPQARLAEIGDKALHRFGAALNDWRLVPTGTAGFRKAEVTRGGVDTKGLSSATMEAREVPGLYFVGEVVDVTGWLGGYNFQWAWASGVAAARAAAARRTADGGGPSR